MSVNSVADGDIYRMTPTQSDWTNFACWNDTERHDLIDKIGFTADQMAIFPSIHFKTDDYTIQSLAFALFLDKIVGMKADLFHFYDGASTLIAEETSSAIFHFEVLKKDFALTNGLDAVARDGKSQIRWLISSNVVAQTESESDDRCHSEMKT